MKNESKTHKNRRLRRASPFRNSRTTPNISKKNAPQDRKFLRLSASRTRGQGGKLHWTSRISSNVHFSEQLSLLHCYYSTNCILLVGISLFTTSRSDILEEVLGFWNQGPAIPVLWNRSSLWNPVVSVHNTFGRFVVDWQSSSISVETWVKSGLKIPFFSAVFSSQFFSAVFPSQKSYL